MTPPRTIMLIGWAAHRALFRLTDGRVGAAPAGSGSGLGTLFLSTTGRRTGKLRRTALFYIDDGPNRVVVASNAGANVDPAWWQNLRADQDASIQLGPERVPVRGREANADEAARLWPRLVAASPAYDTYRSTAGRPIPLVILEPR